MNSKLEEVTKKERGIDHDFLKERGIDHDFLKERGIDHDFLFAVPRENSNRKDRFIVRFKNHKVSVDFASLIDHISSTCKN